MDLSAGGQIIRLDDDTHRPERRQIRRFRISHRHWGVLGLRANFTQEKAKA
jgi:hypothetical protein